MPSKSNPIDVVDWCRAEIVRVTQDLRALQADPEATADEIAAHKKIIRTMERMIAQHSGAESKAGD